MADDSAAYSGAAARPPKPPARSPRLERFETRKRNQPPAYYYVSDSKLADYRRGAPLSPCPSTARLLAFADLRTLMEPAGCHSRGENLRASFPTLGLSREIAKFCPRGLTFATVLVSVCCTLGDSKTSSFLFFSFCSKG